MTNQVIWKFYLEIENCKITKEQNNKTIKEVCFLSVYSVCNLGYGTKSTNDK